jgi:adenosylcobinamide-GDP ribazoletransferase
VLDAWRLAVGTLTAIRVRPPTRVDRTTTRRAMLLAPLAVVPLGVLVALVLWLGQEFDLAPLAVAALAVGALAAGSRAFHLDGLSDTADGLTASYDPERSLAVMRSGSSGPAGTVAVVVVLGVQVLAIGSLTGQARGAVVVGILVCLSRCALLVTCATGVPGARPDGLGTDYTGTVPRPVAAATWVAVAVVSALLGHWLGWSWWRGALTALVAVLVVAVLVRRAVTRFGGVTGDVFGAGIELALATLLLGMT